MKLGAGRSCSPEHRCCCGVARTDGGDLCLLTCQCASFFDDDLLLLLDRSATSQALSSSSSTSTHPHTPRGKRELGQARLERPCLERTAGRPASRVAPWSLLLLVVALAMAWVGTTVTNMLADGRGHLLEHVSQRDLARGMGPSIPFHERMCSERTPLHDGAVAIHAHPRGRNFGPSFDLVRFRASFQSPQSRPPSGRMGSRFSLVAD